MKINGKSLRGLFLYDPAVLYERGDFVVEGSMIYNCIVDSSGETPSTSPNSFSPYMAGNIATPEEVLEGKGIDKFVSIESLVRILDNYYSGFSAAGLITNEIKDNGEIALRDMLGNNLSFSSPSYLDPLDKIIYSNINNCIFKVSRSVVVGILGNGTEDVILRQYSYISGGEVHRTQELIDEERGYVMFRCLVGNGRPTVWKNSIIDNNIVQVASDIQNYYNTKVIELEKEKEYLKNCFRFMEIDDNYRFEGGEVLTFTLEKTKDGLISNHSTTVLIKKDGKTYNYLVGGVKVSITCGTNGALLISGATIIDKYIRKKYDKHNNRSIQ